MPHSATVLDGPDAARVDYLLKHTPEPGGTVPRAYAVDREWADRQHGRLFDNRKVLRSAENFSIAVVRDAVAAGFDQFLDLGCGLPCRSSVHRIARDHVADARVVAVDRSPWVELHWPRMLADGDGHPAFLAADLREVDTVLERIRGCDAFDLTRPVCLTLVDVLHYLCTADARDVLARYYQALPAGSRLAVSQRTSDGASPHHAALLAELATAYGQIGAPIWLRTRQDTARLLGPWTLPQRPGVTSLRHWPLPTWTPVLPDSFGALSWGAVAEKRPS